MSGPTMQQTQLGDQQIAAYQQAAQLTSQQYANQQAIFGPMVKQFQSIYAKGPNQRGFDPEESAELKATAEEGTAENYGNAARAVGEATAARGGGTNPLPTGADLAESGNIATSAAEEESKQEGQIESADYAEGRSEWEKAGEGLETIAAGENPLGYESNETGAGSSAETTAGAIASEDDDWINATLGAVGEIGGGLAAGYCPAHGSMIMLSGGRSVPIETLKAGDTIIGADWQPQKILRIEPHAAQVFTVTTQNGHIARVSPDHAFLLPRGGFTEAADSVGKRVNTKTGESLVIEVQPGETVLVYNLITNGSHTYCADGIWGLGMGRIERDIKDLRWEQVAAELEAQTR